jgi:transposase
MVRIHKEGQMKTKKDNRKAAGIDTGKDKLDIAIHGAHDLLEVANDTAGHEQLIEWLGERKIKRVGIEASGGYEKAVVAALRARQPRRRSQLSAARWSCRHDPWVY